MSVDLQFCARSDSRSVRLPRLPGVFSEAARSTAKRHIGTWGALVFCGMLGFLLFSGTPSLSAAHPVSREYQIKAAFIFNFTKFVEWPAGHFQSDDAPIVLGILGTNPFGDELANAVKGRKMAGREFVVKDFAEIGAAHDAEILFVPASSEKLLQPEMLESLHRAGALTIGESPRFARAGGMITFTTRENRIRFLINREAITLSGLSFSAQLLNLALVTRGDDE